MSVGAIIALVVGGLLLIFCEVFVPGGILGIIGGIILFCGLAAGFMHDVSFGFILLIAALVCGIAGLYLWVKYFPGSPMGKKIFLANDAHEWQGYDNMKKELVGKEGIAHSPLRPSGTALIDGKRVDVVTRGEMIDAKSTIKVVEVSGNRVVVTRV